MKTYRMLVAPLLLCGLAACNGTPTNGLIPGSFYQIEQLNKTTPTGSPFTQALTADYRNLANYEKGEYDWNASRSSPRRAFSPPAVPYRRPSGSRTGVSIPGTAPPWPIFRRHGPA